MIFFLQSRQAMKADFDYIIIDTPPVGILSDVQHMRGLMYGVMLVVRQDLTTRKMVEESVAFLDKARIPMCGCILNCKERMLPKER